jgi:hypothetical protein
LILQDKFGILILYINKGIKYEIWTCYENN